MSLAVIGGGAFGTSLAVVQARAGRDVLLWARDPKPLKHHRAAPRLPGVTLPDRISVTGDLEDLRSATVWLLAVPMQALSDLLPHLPEGPAACVACCKGIDLKQELGPFDLIDRAGRPAAILTGPSFAADIARDRPTALTLAAGDPALGAALQAQLSTPTLRLYTSDDPRGAALGGALKNVIAIACGLAIGAGFGDSARAALMTRGFAEMQRLAPVLGGRPDTLTGLSGMGDLALTCHSELSRNFRFGQSLGAGHSPAPGETVEGAATARAAEALARRHDLDLPITRTVARLVAGDTTVQQAAADLMARPLKKETPC